MSESPEPQVIRIDDESLDRLVNRLVQDPRFIESVISHPDFRQTLANLNVSMESDQHASE